jgi:hypothetical protein
MLCSLASYEKRVALGCQPAADCKSASRARPPMPPGRVTNPPQVDNLPHVAPANPPLRHAPLASAPLDTCLHRFAILGVKSSVNLGGGDGDERLAVWRGVIDRVRALGGWRPTRVCQSNRLRAVSLGDRGELCQNRHEPDFSVGR